MRHASCVNSVCDNPRWWDGGCGRGWVAIRPLRRLILGHTLLERVTWLNNALPIIGILLMLVLLWLLLVRLLLCR